VASRRTLKQLGQDPDPDARAFAKDFLAAYDARYKGNSTPADAAEVTWQYAVDAWLTRYGDGDVRKAEKRAIQQLRVAIGATRRDDLRPARR